MRQMKIINFIAIISVLITVPVVILAGNYAYKSNASMDVVDTAISAESFNTLVAALKAADLVDVLRGDGPFKVFAPTDEAFERLPESTLDNLLKPENEAELQSILTYHVVPGRYLAFDVIGMNSVQTVNGQSFTISKEYSNFVIDNAIITKSDIMTSNGVIHVIDSVIIPKDV